MIKDSYHILRNIKVEKYRNDPNIIRIHTANTENKEAFFIHIIHIMPGNVTLFINKNDVLLSIFAHQ